MPRRKTKAAAPKPAASADKPDGRERFRIVVAGEFNVGKSSLINLLLRQQVLPVSVASSNAPVTRLTTGETLSYRLERHDGEAQETGELPPDAIADQFSGIEVRVPAADLDAASITEVTVGRNADRDADHISALNEADLLIWCTMAQRAWTLSEMEVVDAMPETARKDAIMAVTRADLLESDAQRAAVRQRMKHNSGDLFAEVVMIDSGEPALAAAGKDDAWQRSGGRELWSLVQGHLDRVRADEQPAGADEAPRSWRTVFEAWPERIDAIADWINSGDEFSEEEAAKFIRGQLLDVFDVRTDDFDTNDPLANTATHVVSKLGISHSATGSEKGPKNAEYLLNLSLQLEESLTTNLPKPNVSVQKEKSYVA